LLVSTKRRSSFNATSLAAVSTNRTRAARAARRPRGRPSKFGRPGHVVALTLPDDAIRALQRVDPDVGWAIVKLLDRGAKNQTMRAGTRPDVELVAVDGRQSLIVVNHAVFPSLPGVNLIPLSDSRAFMALDPGRGMSDLELAVIDRLSDRKVTPRGRRALSELRTRLMTWRHDRALEFHARAIIVVERPARRGMPVSGGRRGQS
jgi:hypothetical protein